MNGAHTLLASIALLLGEKFVADSLTHPLLSQLLQQYLYNDVFGVLDGTSETKKYIESIFTRFENKYLEHQWESISLNSLSKFNTRNIPTLLAIDKKGAIPYNGLFALASLWYYYSLEERSDSKYSLFKECLDKASSTQELIYLLLNDKTLYPVEFPEIWKDKLTEYFDTLKIDYYTALEKFLKNQG